jgi:hypothetical protein
MRVWLFNLNHLSFILSPSSLPLYGTLAYNLSLEHLVWTNLSDERWRLLVKRSHRVSL